MRISGLLGAVMALLALTPIAPARAVTLSIGQLMKTDLFRWQGQYGTPTWREILGMYDCTEGLTFYLVNTPQPPPPIVIPPVIDPGGGGGAPIGSIDPGGGGGGGDGGGGLTAVPELSTWAMLLLGLAGLSYAGFRRSKGPISTID